MKNIFICFLLSGAVLFLSSCDIKTVFRGSRTYKKNKRQEKLNGVLDRPKRDLNAPVSTEYRAPKPLGSAHWRYRRGNIIRQKAEQSTTICGRRHPDIRGYKACRICLLALSRKKHQPPQSRMNHYHAPVRRHPNIRHRSEDVIGKVTSIADRRNNPRPYVAGVTRTLGGIKPDYSVSERSHNAIREFDRKVEKKVDLRSRPERSHNAIRKFDRKVEKKVDLRRGLSQ